MEISIEEVDSCTRRVTFTLESGNVDGEVRSRIQKYSKQVSIPGFRKGKVPFSLIEKRYGTEILGEAVLELTKEWLQSEMGEREQQMIGSPVVEKYEQNTETRDYDVAVLYEVVPSVGVLDINECEVVRPLVSISEENLDIEIGNWMRENPKWESVDRPAVVGDRIWAEIDSTDHTSGRKQFNQRSSILLVPDKCEEPVLAACLGKSANERVTAVIHEEPDETTGEDAVKVATYNIQILGIEQPIPDSLNEELLGRLEVESPQDEKFRDAARNALEADCQQSIDQDIDVQVFSWLFDRNRFEMPKVAVREIMFRKLIDDGADSEAARQFVDQGSNGSNSYDWFRRYLDAAVQSKRMLLVENLREHYEMPIDDDKIQEAVAEDLAKLEELVDQDSDNSANMEFYRGVSYQRNRWIAEQENVKSLIAKLLENADYQEIDMTLPEYRTWKEELGAKSQQPSDDSGEESEEPEESPEKSVIVDALGNPMEKQSA